MLKRTELPLELKKFISEDNLIVRHDIPFNIDPSENYNLEASQGFEMIIFPIADFYGFAAQELHIGHEMIKNALAHGKGRMMYSLFVGEKGLCQSIRDDGDYFKIPEVKKCWENGEEDILAGRKKIKSLCGGGLGKESIWKLSELIKVDSAKGILYSANRFNTVLLGSDAKKIKKTLQELLQ